MSNAALVLLRQAATSRPLLVIVDDLPWLDRASAGVLSFVARRLDGSRVGLLGASRTGEDDLFDHVGLPRLEVHRLQDDAAARLLDARVPDLGAVVRERILVEAQGIPLALVELSVALGPEWRASPARALPAALPIGRRLQAIFGPRITRLPTQTRQLLLLMALDGTGDVRVLGAGAGPMLASQISRRPSRADSPISTPRATGSRSTTPLSARRSWTCRRPRSAGPPTGCLPTCGRHNPNGRRGISRKRVSGRTSPWLLSSRRRPD